MNHYSRIQYRHETYKIYTLCGVIICGVIILGCGAYYIWTHPNSNIIRHHTHVEHISKSAKPVKIPNRLLQSNNPTQSRFIKIAIPKSIQGTYIISSPLKQSGIKQYFKVATVIRLTSNDVYEQCLLLPRKAPIFKVQEASDTSSQSTRFNNYQKNLQNQIPLDIMNQVNNDRLIPRISNFNYDGQPGNLTQNGNMLHFQIRLQTMVSSQSINKEYAQLKQVIPNNILPIKPNFQESLNIIPLRSKNKHGLRINNHFFKRISTKQVKKLCNQSNVHPYFLGFNAEHPIDKP